jgi:hypothetical protein
MSADGPMADLSGVGPAWQGKIPLTIRCPAPTLTSPDNPLIHFAEGTSEVAQNIVGVNAAADENLPAANTMLVASRDAAHLRATKSRQCVFRQTLLPREVAS